MNGIIKGHLRRIMWCLTAFLAIAPCLGCGDKTPRVKAGRWPGPTDGVIVYTFSFDPIVLPPSRNGSSLEAARQMELSLGLEEIVGARLTAFGCGTHAVTVKESGELVVLVPTSMAGREAEIEEVLTRPGTLALMIEVRPEEEFQGASAGESKASSPWPPDFPTFLDFQRDEIDRWRRAQTAGESYEPSRVGFRLVLREGTKGTSSQHFGVVREPDPHLTLDQTMFENPKLVTGNLGFTYVSLDIRDEHRDALGGLTGQNIGRRLAVLLDGKLEVAPVIQERLSESIQFPLMRAKDRKRDAQVLVGVLRGGALPVPLALESIE